MKPDRVTPGHFMTETKADPMSREEFISQVVNIVERVQQSAQGILDHLGEASPEDAAKEIADLVPPSAFNS